MPHADSADRRRTGGGVTGDSLTPVATPPTHRHGPGATGRACPATGQGLLTHESVAAECEPRDAVPVDLEREWLR